MNTLKQKLWRFINSEWKPRGYRLTVLEYVQEYWPEELLLQRVFSGPKRFLRLRWWGMKLVCLTLPDNAKHD